MLKIDKNKKVNGSTDYLGYNQSELQERGAIHTAKEISGQPKLWLDTWSLVAQDRFRLDSFLEEAYAHPDLNVLLTGAGTSAFIGDILEGPFQRNSGKSTRAVATTNLVSHPGNYFHAQVPTLLISFARSGNSPESVAAVNLADKLCQKIYHLIITCNPAGELATLKSQNTSLVFHLPPEADDQSLAMTGSFSSMLLAGLLISRLAIIDELEIQVKQLAAYGEGILSNFTAKLKEIAALNFNRAIFLGSGPLHGTARESDLKLQELTDGKIICKHDSFLGFRHGPKAVIDATTLLVYLFSNQAYVHQYELDLAQAISQGDKGIFRLGVIESTQKAEAVEVDWLLQLSDGNPPIDEELLAVCSVMPAQILGFFKSLDLKLKPDAPSVNDSITRVVQGVNIYPFEVALPTNGQHKLKKVKLNS
ncbi:tagatose-6-phosphate ketose isomerase [Adhaeribacter aerolatus]|uniref:Tagatose-6-phosphate ketose isomerase n=1 Tax=Adhaeribacter aerolatus TaxID=670289 RepID=A0A512B3E0_9BACT|nr:SIS domain-containing protein [Adhaeribacter aerolatus]GEO06474.1 tagatose-6-phosphate ketose isomerase [Adhaeribacter aerolatus]